MIPRLALFSSRYYRLVNNQMNIVNRNKAYYRSGAVKVREKSDFEEKQMDFYGHKIFLLSYKAMPEMLGVSGVFGKNS